MCTAQRGDGRRPCTASLAPFAMGSALLFATAAVPFVVLHELLEAYSDLGSVPERWYVLAANRYDARSGFVKPRVEDVTTARGWELNLLGTSNLLGTHIASDVP